MPNDAFFAGQIAILAQKVSEMEARMATLEADSDRDDFEQVLGRPFDEDSFGFSGRAYTPEGVSYTSFLNEAKPWLKYDLSTGIITEEVGPPSDPWPANETWRKKSDFDGAVYF